MNRNVIRRWKRDRHPTVRPLSSRAIVLGAVIVLGIGVAAFTVLLRRYGGTGAELDAIRTAGALTVAAGGAATLLLAARRQAHTERDTSEQRITELYTRAVDQLGAEKAPVRLGGLHALERLAQNNPVQRQTIVDVICAYLRMPYTPPPDHAPGEDAPEDAHSRYEKRRQELQVRLTAQRILAAHLKPEAAALFWADIDLNLTEAHLHQFDLTDCKVRNAKFDGATFTGSAEFNRVTFTGNTLFDHATFTGNAGFRRATFTGNAEFNEATFTGDARFAEATFTGNAEFNEATFTGYAGFTEATFTGDARFAEATFTGDAEFNEATFTGDARFAEATFTGNAGFRWATFTGDPEFGGDIGWFGLAGLGPAEFGGETEFNGARVASSSLGSSSLGSSSLGSSSLGSSFDHVALPIGWITRAARPAEGPLEAEEEGWLYVVRDEDSSEQATEAPGDGPA